MSNTPIGIFVATMTGLAELCAEEVQGALTRVGLSSEIVVMNESSENKINEFGALIVVSSTYGHGDIPDNGRTFYEALTNLPTLGGKLFAVFALGDRTYADTFCHAGEKWDSVLAEKGGTRLCELLRHDASSGTLAEDVAGEWATGWVDLMKKKAA